MTKAESEQLNRIEKLLTDDLEKLDTRVGALEVNCGILVRQQNINVEEIGGLRKASTVWSGINSGLIAIGGAIMVILKGS